MKATTAELATAIPTIAPVVRGSTVPVKEVSEH